MNNAGDKCVSVGTWGVKLEVFVPSKFGECSLTISMNLDLELSNIGVIQSLISRMQ